MYGTKCSRPVAAGHEHAADRGGESEMISTVPQEINGIEPADLNFGEWICPARHLN